MELSNQQREAVQAWVAAGASLSDVQQRLKSEFEIGMTYMEVRLLVLELGVAIREKPEAKPEPAPKPAPKAAPADATEADPYAEEEGAADETVPGSGKVSLTLDRVVAPGAMVSGEVTFSDQVKARWMIDQMGRFGLDPEQPGYHPSDADLQAFQLELRQELQRHGYA